MQARPAIEKDDEGTPFSHTALPALPAVRAIPSTLTSSGAAKTVMLIRCDALAPQLQRFMQAGIRRVEVTVLVEGTTLTFKAAIVHRGKLPVHLHPLGAAGRFLAELYRHRRAASGRRRSPVPLLILSVAPLIEPEIQKQEGGGRP